MGLAPMIGVMFLMILLALIVFVAAVWIVLWLVLRKKPEPRGFEVIQKPQDRKGA